MTMLPATAETVIVGGGVMGCSILHSLALRGMTDAVLLERDSLGSGSTGRSSSAIRMHYSTEVHARMAWESFKVFQNFAEAVGGECGFTRTGHLIMGSEAEADLFCANVAMQQSVGIETRLVTTDEARELAPSWNLDDCGIIAYEPLCGYADASATCMSFAHRARDMGARIALGSPATSIEISSGRVTAVTGPKGRIATERAVIATGPWSRRFLLQHGIDLPLEATRHEVVHLRRGPAGPDYHPGGGDLLNQVYFRPEGSDLTLVGNGNMEDVIEDPEVFAQRASPGFIQEIWTRIARRIPAMEDAQFSGGYAGLYTSTPDSHPIMDAVDGIDGLYVCTGFSGHGFKLSPMVGTLMAELILDGQATSIDITPLRMSRFAEGELNNTGYGFRVMV
ncbi:MAG: FAD-dependent oxidoreductase [Chloroflexota bacterium]|nr:FAD-dependent oxidoreductase [Chloroflexota bacterium]